MNVIIAYNSTDSIPAAGAQRQMLNCAAVIDVLGVVKGVRNELEDFSEKRDVVGTRLKVKIHFGAGVLGTSANRDWLINFFRAKYRWISVGKFIDATNSANDNLCKCDPVDDEYEVSIPFDLQNGCIFVSCKVF